MYNYKVSTVYFHYTCGQNAHEYTVITTYIHTYIFAHLWSNDHDNNYQTNNTLNITYIQRSSV